MIGQVYQINVKPETPGERGLPKFPIDSAFVTLKGIEGDYNRYRNGLIKNGDLDMAVLVMPLEMILQLNSEGWPIKPGDLGENITAKGIPYDSFAPEKVYCIGNNVRIKISRACNPCGNLKLLPYVGREKWPQFGKTMLHRRGWYARVLEAGKIKKEDKIEEVI